MGQTLIADDLICAGVRMRLQANQPLCFSLGMLAWQVIVDKEYLYRTLGPGPVDSRLHSWALAGTTNTKRSNAKPSVV
jgi:hypothetical protein